MEKEKAFIYIDTNFADDEALMLDMAFRSFDFELVGLSSVKSFMSADASALNILGLNEDHELFLPIAKGGDENISGEEIVQKGEDISFYPSHKDYLEEAKACDLLYDLATDCGKIDILATGPLTNLAEALDKYEDLEDYIGHIFIRGGNLYGPDFNFKADAKAIDRILNSSIEVFILPQNLADGIEISDEFVKSLKKDSKNAELLGRILENKPRRSFYGPLLLYLMERPEAFIFEEAAIKVDDKENVGEMIRINSRKKAYLASRVNEASFLDYVKDKLC